MRTADVEPIIAEEMAQLFDSWADQAKDVMDMQELGKYYKEHGSPQMLKALDNLKRDNDDESAK